MAADDDNLKEKLGRLVETGFSSRDNSPHSSMKMIQRFPPSQDLEEKILINQETAKPNAVASILPMISINNAQADE